MYGLIKVEEERFGGGGGGSKPKSLISQNSKRLNPYYGYFYCLPLTLPLLQLLMLPHQHHDDDDDYYYY